MTGNLPSGVTDADIDKAAPGYDEPPFYCAQFACNGKHCAKRGLSQCPECATEEQWQDYQAAVNHARDSARLYGEAIWPDESLPCNWGHMSGECLYCGARLGEECGWDGRRKE